MIPVVKKTDKSHFIEKNDHPETNFGRKFRQRNDQTKWKKIIACFSQG
tara:strand:- start:1224 stop:1367 length:144 start_codon:yes stop_codon:yes gene_type:complete